SFELRRGECLGLIGTNRAGKSTLLKILNGLIKPEKCKIVIKGRIETLIELGCPIHIGRENEYVDGQILIYIKNCLD
ncbi:MAG: ABC transporter ATP-binding protein, partial [Cyclobacteriaceae bacterium]|nr:ABC transporter ATP-binding protein [Cyclobacteriaceae bacterium]